MGLELVQERSTAEPFDPALRLHAAIKTQAMAHGLMVYPGGGTIDGLRGDHVLIAPPFIATDTDLSDIVSRLSDAIDSALVSSGQEAGARHGPCGRVGGFVAFAVASCRFLARRRGQGQDFAAVPDKTDKKRRQKRQIPRHGGRALPSDAWSISFKQKT